MPRSFIFNTRFERELYRVRLLNFRFLSTLPSRKSLAPHFSRYARPAVVALCVGAPANVFHFASARLLNQPGTKRASGLLFGLLRPVRLSVCERHLLPHAGKI